VAGHLTKRGDNTWRLHAYIGRDEKGRRRYATKTVHGTKREADRTLAAFVTEVSRDRTATAAAEPMTVSQVLASWLDAKAPTLSPVTVDRYRIAIKHIEAAIGSMKVARLRPSHIEDLYASMLAKGQSGASIRKVHWALRQSLAWAHRRGYTAMIATDGVELPPLGEKKVEPPATADVRKLLDHLLETNPDWGTLFAVIAWTGCRRGEVCGLHWEDLDLDTGNIFIRRAVVTVKGGTIERGTKTGEMRRIAIGPRTIELLRDHLERCHDRAEACSAEVLPSAYVFSPDVANRQPYSPNSVSRAFNLACRDAGVPHARVHDLRHHSATTLLKNGASVAEVMDRHGWKSVQMINRYRHLLDAQDHEAARTLENA
jgi:integrase